MTLEEYIKNPFPGNSVPALAREGIKNTYKAKFDNVLLRENGKINYFLYKDEKKNIYYAHIKVPSEVIENFYYDTIFKFFADSSITENGRNLEKYNVQFYSNDPAFVFTYCHAFIKNKLFITELSDKMSKEAIKERAKERNPKDLSGYVKSIYFAYLFMKERGLLNKSSWTQAPDVDFKYFLSSIEHADFKIAKRQEEETKRDKRKKIKVDKDTLKNIQKIGIRDSDKKRLVVTTDKIKTVKKTQAINSVKKIGSIKKK